MNVTKKNNSRGRVFQRIYRDRKGELHKTSTWFLKYRIESNPVTIPSGTQDYEEAVAILQQRCPNETGYACHFAACSTFLFRSPYLFFEAPTYEAPTYKEGVFEGKTN
jgi:hypothetical protein